MVVEYCGGGAVVTIARLHPPHETECVASSLVRTMLSRGVPSRRGAGVPGCESPGGRCPVPRVPRAAGEKVARAERGDGTGTADAGSGRLYRKHSNL